MDRTILLVGLPEKFAPMKMAIQQSGSYNLPIL